MQALPSTSDARQVARTVGALYALSARLMASISERDILKAPLKDKIRASTMLCDMALEIEKSVRATPELPEHLPQAGAGPQPPKHPKAPKACARKATPRRR